MLSLLRLLPGIIGLALVIAFLRANDKAAEWKRRAETEMAGRADDRRAYELAQQAAAEKNRAEVARIEADQERISNARQADLAARLERLRRELRAQQSPAAGSQPRSTGAGADGKTAGGTDEAAGVCLTPDQLLRGAENEERHDQLIRWVEEQLRVRR